MALDFPILRIEIEHSRHVLLQALSKYEDGISEAMRAQIERQLTPENIQAMVEAAVRAELPGVIRGAIATAMTKMRWDETILNGVLWDALGRAVKDLKEKPA